MAGFSNMSSEEDVPAPSPSAAVVARRAGKGKEKLEGGIRERKVRKKCQKVQTSF